MNPIKPGTRCECGDCLLHQKSANTDGICFEDAIKLVLVTGRGNFVPIPGFEKSNFRHVPMCATCADWHESKGK